MNPRAADLAMLLVITITRTFRQAANVLDLVKQFTAMGVANGVAEQTTQQLNIAL